MPLYEYECDACGHRFEKIQKFSDPPIETCPKCGGHVHKVQSAPAFHLKGTGWYITDYAKKDQSTPAKSESGSAAKSTPAADKTEKSDKSEKVEKPSQPEKSSAASDAPASPATKDKSA